MKMENEITVMVKCDYMTLHRQLIDNGFKIKEEYTLNDSYMVNKDVNIYNMDNLEILKKCILVRSINGIKKVLLYKYKEFDSDGSIIKQGEVECPIEDINKAISFMNAINYKELFEIKDKCIVYANDKTELIVQLVNDEYIFIEMEDECAHINKKYSSIDELKEDIKSYNFSVDYSNFFVKKAEIMLDTYKENNKNKV